MKWMLPKYILRRKHILRIRDTMHNIQKKDLSQNNEVADYDR